MNTFDINYTIQFSNCQVVIFLVMFTVVGKYSSFPHGVLEFILYNKPHMNSAYLSNLLSLV